MFLGGRLHERLRQINPRKVGPQVAWYQKNTAKAQTVYLLRRKYFGKRFNIYIQ